MKNNLIIIQIVLAISLIAAACEDERSEKKEFSKNMNSSENATFSDSLKAEKMKSKIDYNETTNFSYNEEKNTFSLQGIQLNSTNNTNTFLLSENGKPLGKLDLDSTNYEGPGYLAYLYESNKTNDRIIILEATADIGTAWYYVVFLSKTGISKTFFIHEPRGNEKEALKKFLSIYSIGDEFTFRFKKKHIGKYSTIPKSAKQDNEYVYLTKFV